VTIAARLRAIIAFRGLSIRDFADITQIPYRTLQDYLGSDRRPRADHLTRMATSGIDLNWLLTGRSSHLAEDHEHPLYADIELLASLRQGCTRIADQVIGDADGMTVERVAEHLERLFRKVLAVAEEDSEVITDLRVFKTPKDVVVSYVLGETINKIVRERSRRAT
jgi:transcriptional regulator with XRE-family HTH domain